MKSSIDIIEEKGFAKTLDKMLEPAKSIVIELLTSGIQIDRLHVYSKILIHDTACCDLA